MVSQSIAMFGTGSGAAEPDIQAFGNKGANLVAMASIGLPIPPGCIINTSIGAELASLESKLSDALLSDIQAAIDGIGKSVGRTYGDDQNPLLISVRSSAAVSMPGMMDTVLNLGLNDQAVEGLAAQFEDERFAWDTPRLSGSP